MCLCDCALNVCIEHDVVSLTGDLLDSKFDVTCVFRGSADGLRMHPNGVFEPQILSCQIMNEMCLCMCH